MQQILAGIMLVHVKGLNDKRIYTPTNGWHTKVVVCSPLAQQIRKHHQAIVRRPLHRSLSISPALSWLRKPADGWPAESLNMAHELILNECRTTLFRVKSCHACQTALTATRQNLR